MARITIDFTADGTGNEISFVPSGDTNLTIDAVSLREIVTEQGEDTFPVKTFLDGNTDDGKEIFFRADTQELQIQKEPELYSSLNSVVTETERGSSMKVFVSLDEKPFYELKGIATKGISILKTNSRDDDKTSPPLAKSVKISYRDSSKQLCRLNQMALIVHPRTIDHSE